MLTCAIVSVWINASEIFRYFTLVMPMTRETLATVPNVAPMNLPVFLVWGLWDTLLVVMSQRVEVAEGEVRIMGSRGNLLRTLAAASGVASAGPVPSFVPRWRTGWDSNPRYPYGHFSFRDGKTDVEGSQFSGSFFIYQCVAFQRFSENRSLFQRLCPILSHFCPIF
jgi:hypothetical protein